MGYRGVDADNPELRIIHRGKARRITPQEKRALRRRQAIEPLIGHLKADHRMVRCPLKGSLGDCLHAVLCAAGYNIRWLLRMIAQKGIPFLSAIFCALRWLLEWTFSPMAVAITASVFGNDAPPRIGRCSLA